jgi:hypothetical protein
VLKVYVLDEKLILTLRTAKFVVTGKKNRKCEKLKPEIIDGCNINLCEASTGQI